MITQRTYTIHAERSSVCMGDDCNAPNASELPYTADEMLSAFMKKVENYVPTMKNTVWRVVCDRKTIAYIIYAPDGCPTIELAVKDQKVIDLPKKEIVCIYYYQGKFLDYSTKPPVEMYPQCKTLLEKVKMMEKNQYTRK